MTAVAIAVVAAGAAMAAINPSEWRMANANWGGNGDDGHVYNGGVVPENVRFEGGRAYLAAHGNLYTGRVRGVDKQGRSVVPGIRTGACLVSKTRMHYGSYRVRMKVVPHLGCCTAIWTFRYDASGGKVLNHEIDIEMPGRPGPGRTGIGFDYALCNTWIGEDADRYTTGYTHLPARVDDGEFHDFRFDWHYDRVEYYVDGSCVQTNRSHVPNIPGEFWVGAWFPKGWTGTPDFDEAEAVVDDFSYTPYEAEIAGALEATVPDDGQTVPLQNAYYSNWLAKGDNERRADLESSSARKTMYEAGSLPRPVRIAWIGGDGNGRIVVRRASDGKVVADENARGNDFILENLEANRAYSWEYTCRSLRTGAAFRTADAFPRQLHWDGVKNVRDLGGRATLGGRRVRQGLIYRSAAFEDCTEVPVTNSHGKVVDYIYPIGKTLITPKGIETATRTCGVRTDLDLRSDVECAGLESSALGSGVRRIHIPFYAYGKLGEPTGMAAMRSAWAVFMDESNYPIDFHCISGADRTGTLAFVLNGLLGVPEGELVRDWEVTAFSSRTPNFTHEKRLDKLIAVFDAFDGETINERIEKFVLSCGIQPFEIELFRSMMFE